MYSTGSGNLLQTYTIRETYVDKDDSWSGILAAAVFIIFSTENRLKCYIIGQFVFGRDMIPPINHTVDWEFTRQKNQTKINKTRKNNKRVDHD